MRGSSAQARDKLTTDAWRRLNVRRAKRPISFLPSRARRFPAFVRLIPHYPFISIPQSRRSAVQQETDSSHPPHCLTVNLVFFPPPNGSTATTRKRSTTSEVGGHLAASLSATALRLP